jgi:hypothetical protein
MQDVERQMSGCRAPLADVIESLGGPVFGFSEQPRLELFDATVTTAQGRVVAVALSYSFFQHPHLRDDSRNFVALTPEQRSAISRAETSTEIPSWLRDQVRRLRYPTLFEAVRTSLRLPGEDADAVEPRLRRHVDDALSTSTRSNAGADRIDLGAPAPSSASADAALLLIEGEECPGCRIDVRPRLFAVGALVGDRFVTALIPKDLEAVIVSAFVDVRSSAS